MKGLIQSFADFPDPRRQGRIQHRFIDVLIIAVSAVIAGADSWTDIASYGRSKDDWLRTFLRLEAGIPSHDTFRRVFTLLDPETFEQCFYEWVRGFFLALDREVIAIDGKTVRRSFNKAIKQGPLHIVSAFATEQGISLGQLAVDGKSNEITAIPELLSRLSLKGNIVTLDAMGCQRGIAQNILDQQADYILALKGNQSKKHKAVVAFCHTECLSYPSSIKPTYDAFDDRHGRTVRRRGWVIPVTDRLSDLHDWPGVQNVVMVETIRSVQYVKGVTSDLRYYLSSCADAPEIQIAAVRKHWAIENSLHWVLDVTFREDDSRIREQVSTRMFAQLRKMALNIVKRDKSSKISLRARRKSAGWDNSYMEALLFNNHP
ncbi:ISAs1 family transposase [Yersinia enterocolitica]|nr:ISAs1 family transposase [Yersinia enterocolitica]